VLNAILIDIKARSGVLVTLIIVYYPNRRRVLNAFLIDIKARP